MFGRTGLTYNTYKCANELSKMCVSNKHHAKVMICGKYIKLNKIIKPDASLQSFSTA